MKKLSVRLLTGSKWTAVFFDQDHHASTQRNSKLSDTRSDFENSYQKMKNLTTSQLFSKNKESYFEGVL